MAEDLSGWTRGPSLAHRLYEGVVELPGWKSFLAEALVEFSADSSSLAVISTNAEYPEVLLFASEPLEGARYREIERLGRQEAILSAAPGQACIVRHDASQAPEGIAIGESLHVRVAVDAITSARFSLWRNAGRPEFESLQRAHCERLAPALQRAARIFVRYAAAERERVVYRNVLDQIGVGVIVVDPKGGVMATNDVAAEILRQGADLQVVQGGLRAADARVTRALIEYIRDRADAQLLPRGASGRPIAIRRADSAVPLTAVVHPGPHSPLVNAPLRRSAVVIMRDPERRTAVSTATVADLFALTPAEAALAAEIAQGATLEEAAERLGVRRNTVRNQLQSIFLKTETRRQSELVRLILHSVATLSAG